MATFRDLIVYKKAFNLAMEIFNMVRAFPKEEKYSLIDQIIRSSRSVCQCRRKLPEKKICGAFYFESHGCRHGKFGNTGLAGL